MANKTKKKPFVNIDTTKGNKDIKFIMEDMTKKYVFTLLSFVAQMREVYKDSECEFVKFKTEITFKEVYDEEEQAKVIQLDFNPTISGKSLHYLVLILADALSKVVKKNEKN